MRHVLGEIEVDALLRDLDPAGLLAGPVERLARGVIDLHAVDEHPVVMEPRHLRFRGRGPEAILALLRGIPLAIKEPEDDLLGVRRLDPERHAQVGMDPGILLATDVAGAGMVSTGFELLCLIGGRGQRGGAAGRRTTRCSSVDLPCWFIETSVRNASHSLTGSTTMGNPLPDPDAHGAKGVAATRPRQLVHRGRDESNRRWPRGRENRDARSI